MATDTVVDQRVGEVLVQLRQQVEQLLILLSQRERFVIEKRFGLDKGDVSTLEEIGQQFNVTRERVRQIEKNALQKLKRNVDNTNLSSLTELAFGILTHEGGLMREDSMIGRILAHQSAFEVSAVLFILSLDKRFMRFSNTILRYPHFRLSDMGDELLLKIADKSTALLTSKKDVVDSAELRSKVVSDVKEANVMNVAGFESLYSIHKSFKLMGSKVGLIQWKHIHPRTLRDKIYFILRKKGASLHFIDIANSIMEANFDRKKINLQAVHNELIRHDGFVLIGRGIYALKEWGYASGTVSEVIEGLLREHRSLSEERIVSEVLKKRQVKPITIILNLKNKPQFLRIGRKQYALK
ncbi:MAG TPA: sigma factor-like helix-turn-helix DNA-binding protein [Candidatus Gracilibacteria bacterium]|nr:sigma factor-like helix-turn-helix DNA-binding protein [Candidatus Gracilibacteria bacterium]